MVYFLVMAVELNKIGHNPTIPKRHKNTAMHLKSKYMRQAYLICQRCNFKNVHCSIAYDRDLLYMCVMNFRFDGVRGESVSHVTKYNRYGTPRNVIYKQKYNHITLSLHIPLNHITGCNKIKSWGEESKVRNNPRQKSLWSAKTLARHNGLECFF